MNKVILATILGLSCLGCGYTAADHTKLVGNQTAAEPAKFTEEQAREQNPFYGEHKLVKTMSSGESRNSFYFHPLDNGDVRFSFIITESGQRYTAILPLDEVEAIEDPNASEPMVSFWFTCAYCMPEDYPIFVTLRKDPRLTKARVNKIVVRGPHAVLVEEKLIDH